MKKLALTTALALALGISATAQAHSDNEGYATTSANTVWKTSSGDCWHHTPWEEANRTEECGAVMAMPAPAAAPAPAPADKWVMVDADESHIVYFDFDSSEVKDVSEITNYVSSFAELGSIKLSGYTDRIGNDSYNNTLSQRRVEAVNAALASAGIDTAKMATLHYGESNPVKECTESGDSLKSCLAANRRVEVAITGKKQVKVQQ